MPAIARPMRLLPLLVLVTCCLCGVALSQDNPAEATQRMEEVVVPQPASTQAKAETVKAGDARVNGSSIASSPLAADVLAILVLAVLGGGTILFAFEFLSQVKRGHTVGVESHWGGLGGGLGGWRISAALSFLVASLVFALAFSAVAVKFLDSREQPDAAVKQASVGR